MSKPEARIYYNQGRNYRKIIQDGDRKVERIKDTYTEPQDNIIQPNPASRTPSCGAYGSRRPRDRRSFCISTGKAETLTILIPITASTP